MRGRRRPPLLESPSRVLAAAAAAADAVVGNKSRKDGWRGISEESVLREVCHHLKWAQEMKDMYERQVAVCQRQLEEHQQQNKTKAAAAADDHKGMEVRMTPKGFSRDVKWSRQVSEESNQTVISKSRRRQPHFSRRAEEGTKLTHDKPQARQHQRVPSSKHKKHFLPVLQRPIVTPASVTSQGRPPVNLVPLPALRTPSSVNRVVDRQALQLRQTVRPSSLLVHHLVQVKEPTPAKFLEEDLYSTVDEQHQLWESLAEISSPTRMRSLPSKVHVADIEENDRSAEGCAHARRGRKKKANKNVVEHKPARKRTRGHRNVKWAQGVEDPETSDSSRQKKNDEVSDVTAGVKDTSPTCDNDSEDSDDEIYVGGKGMISYTGRDVDTTKKSVRHTVVSGASYDLLSLHPRYDEWSSIFKRLQDDGEIHCDRGAWALRLAGYPKPNAEWVHNILKGLTQYSTLDLHEFATFMQLYETREHEEAVRLFAEYDLDRSGTIDMDELSLLVAAFGVTPLNDAIREIVQDVSPANADELTLDEFWKVLMNFHENEGFAKSEVANFKLLFEKFDLDGSGAVDETELYRMLRYMGYELDPEVTHSILQDVDADGNGSLDEREFLVCMRKVREHEVARVQEILRTCDADGSGGISYDELFTVLRSLGYFPGDEEIMDAYADAGLDPDEEMVLDDLWKFLHTYREREGFSRKDMEGIAKVFCLFDQDRSGELDTSEVVHMFLQLGIAVSCNQAQLFVANVDIDGSGTIDMREFTKILRQHHQHEASEARNAYCRHGLKKAQLTAAASERLNGMKDSVKAMIKRLVPEARDHDASKVVEELGVAQELSGEVDQYEFVGYVTELHAKARRDMLDNHGFSYAQVGELREQFSQYDVGKKGFLVHREVHNLLENLFPRLATSAACRPELVKIMQDANIEGSIDVESFLRLSVKCRELQARDILKREKESIAKGNFSPQEVKELRKLFTSESKRDSFMDGGTSDSMSLPQLREMLSNFIPMGHKNSQSVAKVFREIVAERDGECEADSGELKADFSEFLLILRRLMDLDIAGINECARRASSVHPPSMGCTDGLELS